MLYVPYVFVYYHIHVLTLVCKIIYYTRQQGHHIISPNHTVPEQHCRFDSLLNLTSDR